MENEKKYDTNPLDQEAARRAEEAWSGEATRALPQRDTGYQGELNEDAPTRQFAGNAAYQPYQSPYAPPPPQSAPYQYQTPYQPPPFPAPLVPPTVSLPATSGKPTSRQVPGLNLPENLLMIAPYLPFWVGAVAALVELFVTPRHEKRVRFHAAQGLAMQLAVTLIPLILRLAGKFGSVIGAWTKPLGLVAALFSVASAIYFIIYLIKVWKGEETPVETLAGPTQWLDENIAPREK